MEQSLLIVKPVAPFRLDLTAWVLRRRSNNIVDLCEDGVYKRVLVVNGKLMGIAVRQSGTVSEPTLRIILSAKTLNGNAKSAVKQAVIKMLGTQKSLEAFYSFADRDQILGSIVKRYRGFKPPRFESVFEAAVNGICCQQLSLDVGIILLNRLVAACAKRIDNAGERMYAFPTAAQVACLTVAELRKLGFSGNKAKALTELAADVVGGDINLEHLEALDDEQAIQKLMTLRGLGRWTAEYVLLRGLGRTHIYPGDDSGFANGLKRWLSMKGKMDRAVVQTVMSKWPRYGGMVYFHLLLERLTREGLIDSSS